jgi:NAD(P)-dependent dehydrogenase (short-subunit alcohol dehydrogenase family)
VNCSSLAGLVADDAGRAAYDATKHGVIRSDRKRSAGVRRPRHPRQRRGPVTIDTPMVARMIKAGDLVRRCRRRGARGQRALRASGRDALQLNNISAESVLIT